MAMKFYTSVAKGLKLKVRNFCWFIPLFVEVTGEKLVKGTFLPLPPQHKHILNRVKPFRPSQKGYFHTSLLFSHFFMVPQNVL